MGNIPKAAVLAEALAAAEHAADPVTLGAALNLASIVEGWRGRELYRFLPEGESLARQVGFGIAL